MVKIEEIINQNPWWKHGGNFGKYDVDLTRLQNQKVRVERDQINLEKGDIYVLRGCRQIGKTTYIKTNIEKLISGRWIAPRAVVYLAVDRFFTRKELRSAIDYFLKRNRDANKVIIFLDEITTLENWNLELKYLSDSGVMQKACVFVTGSSGEALRRVSEQLPGRGLEGNEYYLKPLSFRKFIFQTIGHFIAHAESGELNQSLSLLNQNLKNAKITLKEDPDEIIKIVDIIAPFKNELEYMFYHFIRCGGFPIAINQYIEKKETFEPDLVETFVRTILGELTKHGKNETTARQILKEIIDKYGSRFSFTKLAGQVNISHVTASEYLEFLEKSFVLSVLYAYNFSKKDIRYKGNKKIYFQDPFIFYSLKSFLSGKDVNDIISETFEDEEILSKIIEGLVFSHLSMNEEIPYIKETNNFLWFYYNVKGRELDYILNKNGIYLGIEVKYQNDVSPRDVIRISEIENYIILSKNDLSENENTIVVPVEVLLALLETSEHNL